MACSRTGWTPLSIVRWHASGARLAWMTTPQKLSAIYQAFSGASCPAGTGLDSGPTDEDSHSDEEGTAPREPRVRGRAPIFENEHRSIASLISDIEREVIALPDLQRPFVWEDTKVRDLLDLLFVGFPVGTLVFWHTSDNKDARALGADRPGLRATTLVIDGQQRLTSLYAVMKGEQVVGKEGEMRRISIAFRPRDGRFEGGGCRHS